MNEWRMTVCCENRFRHDAATLRSVYAAVSGRRQTWVMSLCLAILLAASLTETLRHGIFYPGWVLMALIAFLWWYSSPGRMARAAEKRRRQQCGGELPEVTTRFTDIGIFLSEAECEQHFDYTEVVRLSRTKGMLLIRLAGRLCIPVPDDGFVSGDAAMCEAWLRKQCRRLKR